MEQPIRILDEAERRTRNNTVKFYKVQWSHHSDKEATWEREDHLRAEYPDLFVAPWRISGRDSFEGGSVVTARLYLYKFVWNKNV